MINTKVYKIADIRIGVCSNCRYEEAKAFVPFITNEGPDILVNFNICSEVSYPCGESVYKDPEFEVIQNNNTLYRIYYDTNDRSLMAVLKVDSKNKILDCCIQISKSKFFLYTNNYFKVMSIEKIINQFNGLILHSSFLSTKYGGILFSGPCGAGKSTQAELWQSYEEAEIINGDKVAIRKKDGVWTAYGLPYAGSSHIFKNKYESIRAIIILEQGQENCIRRLKSLEAFRYVYSEAIANTWDKRFQKIHIDLIVDIVENVPIYKLSCLPDRGAVDIVKKILEEELINDKTN